MNEAERLFVDRATGLLGELPPIPPLPEARGTIVVTGIGGSEGPARIHAHALRARGATAAFVPVSGIARVEADELRVFSQNLSPNARIALAAAPRFSRALLVTAASAVDGFSGDVVRHPPESEDGLLVRVLGPTLATRIAFGASADGKIVRAAFERGARIAAELPREALAGQVAFVLSGDDGERFFGLRWKWLETLGTCDPPIYDVLSFTHGPFQRWFEQPLTFVALRSPGDDPGPWSAFTQILRPGQRVVTLDALATMPHAWFEHDAMQNALLCRALGLGVGHGPRWLGYGADRPLYELCAVT
jgi:hypothetical protein